MEVFLRSNLKFGDMSIFHRVNPMTKELQFSIANAVEPGTFDFGDVEAFKTAGVCLFLRLPGPQEAMQAFEDMLHVAKDLAQHLGGEIKDDRRSAMTAQTVEHCRQRIADFERKRMSARA